METHTQGKDWSAEGERAAEGDEALHQQPQHEGHMKRKEHDEPDAGRIDSGAPRKQKKSRNGALLLLLAKEAEVAAAAAGRGQRVKKQSRKAAEEVELREEEERQREEAKRDAEAKRQAKLARQQQQRAEQDAAAPISAGAVTAGAGGSLLLSRHNNSSSTNLLAAAAPAGMHSLPAPPPFRTAPQAPPPPAFLPPPPPFFLDAAAASPTSVGEGTTSSPCNSPLLLRGAPRTGLWQEQQTPLAETPASPQPNPFCSFPPLPLPAGYADSLPIPGVLRPEIASAAWSYCMGKDLEQLRKMCLDRGVIPQGTKEDLALFLSGQTQPVPVESIALRQASKAFGGRRLGAPLRILNEM